MSQPANYGAPLAAEAPLAPSVVATRINASLTALLDAHSGTTRPGYAVPGTVWRNSTTAQLNLFVGSATDLQIAVNVGVPASASATGVAGDVAWDADHFYVCTATDTWKRVAVATW